MAECSEVEYVSLSNLSNSIILRNVGGNHTRLMGEDGCSNKRLRVCLKEEEKSTNIISKEREMLKILDLWLTWYGGK